MGPPRCDAVGHHALVEFSQAVFGALRLLIIRAKLERRQLAEKVAAVGRVVGAALGFLPRRRRGQMSFLLEELRGLIDGPFAGVQANAGDQTADARERLADLRHFVTWVVRAETLVDHHLLGIMRPAVLSRRRLWKRVEANPDAPH